MADPSRGIEEQYIIRILDPALREKMQRAMASGAGEEGMPETSIHFTTDDRQGVWRVDGKDYGFRVLDLPTIVESYKTYDDANLVKTTDIGQIFLVGEEEGGDGEGEGGKGEGRGPGEAGGSRASREDEGKSDGAGEEDGGAAARPSAPPRVPSLARHASPDNPLEFRHGLTPPLRDVRERVFRPAIHVTPETVSKVEHDLLTILAGGAPQGVQFVDHEEIWVIDEQTGEGHWVPVPR